MWKKGGKNTGKIGKKPQPKKWKKHKDDDDYPKKKNVEKGGKNTEKIEKKPHHKKENNTKMMMMIKEKKHQY